VALEIAAGLWTWYFGLTGEEFHGKPGGSFPTLAEAKADALAWLRECIRDEEEVERRVPTPGDDDDLLPW
jgi:hypothetical protein